MPPADEARPSTAAIMTAAATPAKAMPATVSQFSRRTRKCIVPPRVSEPFFASSRAGLRPFVPTSRWVYLIAAYTTALLLGIS